MTEEQRDQMLHALHEKVGRLSLQVAHLAERVVDAVGQAKQERSVLFDRLHLLDGPQGVVTQLRLTDAGRSGSDSSRGSAWQTVLIVLGLAVSLGMGVLGLVLR